ncbi:MAG: methyltransferase domain-containing protein [Aggregatilineales bacterium]
MSTQDRVRWDTIYRKVARKPYPAPDPILLEYTPAVPQAEERHALDLAAGVGQNGLWLAEQGYVTDVMDISRVALYRARVEMTIRNLRNVNLLQIDLDELELESYYYDQVCVFRYLKRDSLPAIRDSVKPGGRIIYETYNLHYLTLVPEFNTKFLLQEHELLDGFKGWNILCHEESDHVTRLVAVRPEDTDSIAHARSSRSRHQKEAERKDSNFEW